MVERKFIKSDPYEYIVEFNQKLKSGGLLLVSEGSDKKPNAMTIGWGFIGTMWSLPVIVVAVRHSRHTFKLLEDSKVFTVCMPSKDMSNVLDVCGTKSGRTVDKFKELNLTAKKSMFLNSTYIEECPIFFECSIIYKVDVTDGVFDSLLNEKIYKTKDFHKLYFGEIKGTYSVDDYSS
ncbi:flavin reductase family protein [Candidatus Bathyarchaeota archaeon]|nr:flavin reductase family protein [Candidatus Bathyarchaeota archaeon]